MNPSLTIFTVGHSNRSIEDFIELLHSHHIQVIVDVRSSPYSRYAPQFSKRPLQQALGNAGVRYIYLGDSLGGIPAGEEFYDAEGYVLYDRIAATDSFQAALGRVIEGAAKYRVALMCAEENPAGCHRRLLVSRALRDRDVSIRHIRGDGSIVDDASMGGQDSSASAQSSLFDSPAPAWRSPNPVRRQTEPPRGPFDPLD